MTVSDLRRLKSLEAENRRLRQIVAEQALDNRALKELLSKNF
jgi:putative transposase